MLHIKTRIFLGSDTGVENPETLNVSHDPLVSSLFLKNHSKKRKVSAAEHQIQRVKEILSENPAAWNSLQIDRLALFSFDNYYSDNSIELSHEQAKKFFDNIKIETLSSEHQWTFGRILIRFHQIKLGLKIRVARNWHCSGAPI